MHNLTKKICAVKSINKDICVSQNEIDRRVIMEKVIVQEARLRHPNVV
jgi:serine/threonine protein kinase